MNQAVTPAASPRYQPSSVYVDGAFYDWLSEVSADLNQPVIRSQADPVITSELTRLVTLESRLLDQQAFDSWLGLLSDECAYWIPPSQPAPDLRQTISLEFHDRRRLLDRVTRLRTGLAFSQLPHSRTSRLFSGLEIWASPGRDDEWRARCNFVIAESRAGHRRTLGGWNGFVFRRESSGLKIVLKQINLLDGDYPQGNNSFFL